MLCDSVDGVSSVGLVVVVNGPLHSSLALPCLPPQVVNSLQQQPQAASPSVPETHSLAPVAQADPLVRRQRVQDLMAQMQGPYNFIQVGAF